MPKPKIKIVSDAYLAEGIRNRRRQDLEALYDKHAPALLGLILKVEPDMDKACDLLKGVFVRIWDELPKLSLDASHLLGWMTFLVRKTLANYQPTEAKSSRFDLLMSNLNRTDAEQNELVLLCIMVNGWPTERVEQELGLTTEEVRASVKGALSKFKEKN